MSVFLVKILKIRGSWGLCPPDPLNPGCAPLFRILDAPLDKPMKFYPPPEILGWLRHYSSSYPHGSAPGPKLQKLSKESGTSLSLAPLVLFYFTKRQRQKGGRWHNAPLNTLLPRSLKLGTCERKISLLKEVNTFTNVDLAAVFMLAGGKLEFIKQSPSDLYWSKVHDKHDVGCNNKEGVWGALPPRRCMVTQISAPPLPPT